MKHCTFTIAPRIMRGTPFGAATLALVLGITGRAHAQRQVAPEERQQRRDERRQNFQNMTPEQRQQAWQQRLQNMTPEQRQQMQQRMTQMQQQVKQQQEDAKWTWIRQDLTAAGYKDTAMQDAIVAFMQAQDKAHQPLQKQAFDLTTLLVNPATPETQLTTELASFRKAVTDDKARYNTELTALDQKVNFSKQPRLEALLAVLGVVGYEAPDIGGVGAIFPDSPMGANGALNLLRTMGGGRGGGGGGGNGGGGNGAGGNGAGAAGANAAAPAAATAPADNGGAAPNDAG